MSHVSLQRLPLQILIVLLSATVARPQTAPTSTATVARAQTAPTTSPATTQANAVEQWDIFEIELKGPADANSFDVKLSARFTSGQHAVEAKGFYDGNGTYRVRFMPGRLGAWRYETSSDAALAGKSGEFTCVKPSPGNHGPVGIANTYHFAYADGTPFVPISTTIYGWAHQRSDALQKQTLFTLKHSPFNRVRMAVLPINYGDDNAPRYMPFEEDRNDNDAWIYSRFVPQYFQHIEKRLGQLREMGIEAELILFHNRDGGRTELDRMPAKVDDRYVRYVLARFSAYRNVWWNLANEFDGIRSKRDSDWDRIFQIVEAEDPYHHPRSIHEQNRYYDFHKPWLTYLSVQSELAVEAVGRARVYRTLSNKPVIFDEVKYEGDIPQPWGRLTGEELTRRFWLATIGGTYATHGETFANAPDVRWISRGGELVGLSPKRIAFLKEILATAPPTGLNPIEQDETTGMAGRPGYYYLIYFGNQKPADWTFSLPRGRIRPGTQFKVDVLDTWNMTITPIDQVVTAGRANESERVEADPPVKVPLPARPYMALRIRRVE
jgi:hypothetical protein